MTFIHRMMNKDGTKAVKRTRMSKRKKLIIAVSVITVLAGVSYVLTSYPELFRKKTDKSSPTSMYSDKLTSYIFYESDYDLDVTSDEWYMQLDRMIHYKNGNVTVGLDEDEIADGNDAVRFFADYFETIIAGDAETYNTYFTDSYYDEYEPYVRFAPQMLYNIEIEQLTETENDDRTTEWTFNVSYMIYRNDGTFRNDIPSDASKKLYFRLIGDADGVVKIDYITYYKRS